LLRAFRTLTCSDISQAQSVLLWPKHPATQMSLKKAGSICLPPVLLRIFHLVFARHYRSKNLTIGCTGQISAVAFCAKTRTKGAIKNLLGEPGVIRIEYLLCLRSFWKAI